MNEFDPLEQEPDFATRDKAAGIMGDKGAGKSNWGKILTNGSALMEGKGDCLTLDCGRTDLGAIRINLDWTEPEARNFKEKMKAAIGIIPKIDLDLGVMYELSDGTRGAVQAFGALSKSYDDPPYISLNKDDQSGVGGGEDLLINGKHWDKFRRIVIYAYIYKGVCNWSETDAWVRLYIDQEAPLFVNLEKTDALYPVCAVALLDNEKGLMKATNLNEFFTGQREMDRAFGFGINWTEGSKQGA